MDINFSGKKLVYRKSVWGYLWDTVFDQNQAPEPQTPIYQGNNQGIRYNARIAGF